MGAKHLHFIGIAGHTMSGIALAAKGLGYKVTGTDAGAYPPVTNWLDENDIKWWRESDAKHVEKVDRVIISGGVQTDDVELVAALEAKIQIQSYPEFIGELAQDKHQIVVAGTHGKTTTTSLITWIFEAAGRDPDYLVGIRPHNFDTSVRLTGSRLMVLEGDEYKASALDTRSKFLYYTPNVLVATSLEMDHPDVFKNLGEIRKRFVELMKRVPKDGRILICADSAALKQAAKEAGVKAESYGEGGEWHADHQRFTPTGIAFDLYRKDTYYGHFTLPLYGEHNVDNATAAIVVALGEGLLASQIQHGCESFLGAARRFSRVSEPGAKVTVIDDYAHHPTEIAATIAAAKLHFGGRVIAVVRPHTYSRTRELLPEYRSAVRLADEAFITDIEGAREKHLKHTVSGKDIVHGNGQQVKYEPDRAKLVEQLLESARPGDTIVCMTVSGYDGLAEELTSRLKTE